MHVNYWDLVYEVIHKADIILEILDARIIDETRNKAIEYKIQKLNKPIIFVINKCDLVHKELLESKKKELEHCVYVSSKDRAGTTILKNKILALGKKEKIHVGVVGYPNTGKSSIINALAGASKASTSSQAGHTKGIQLVKASNRIYLLDTPGVIPFNENDATQLAIICSKNPQKVKDADVAAVRLIEKFDGIIERFYGIEKQKDTEKTLELIAEKMNKRIKGGEFDIEAAARQILYDWQKGKINLV
jgi:ribosome biogenesis GTPase A